MKVIPADKKLEIANQQFPNFSGKFKSVNLATINSHGFPQASYSPFVESNGKFYVLLSDLADHAHNMRNSSQLSLMFLEDESECKNIFARKRLTYRCQSREINRDSDEFVDLANLYQEKYGEFGLGMTTLVDFNFFEIEPEHGTFVIGFGMAFNVELSNPVVLKLIAPKSGHGVKRSESANEEISTNG